MPVMISCMSSSLMSSSPLIRFIGLLLTVPFVALADPVVQEGLPHLLGSGYPHFPGFPRRAEITRHKNIRAERSSNGSSGPASHKSSTLRAYQNSR